MIFVFVLNILKQDGNFMKTLDPCFSAIQNFNFVDILQECDPNFTLKLTSLQHPTFDTKGGGSMSGFTRYN